MVALGQDLLKSRTTAASTSWYVAPVCAAVAMWLCVAACVCGVTVLLVHRRVLMLGVAG